MKCYKLLSLHCSQLSSSLLPSLDTLISLLREDVELFLTLFTPYRLPESCDLDTACTENELHAEELSLNASVIVGYVLVVQLTVRTDSISTP